MGRFVAYFRYLVHFLFLLIYPTQWWATLRPLAPSHNYGPFCDLFPDFGALPVFSEFTLHIGGPLCDLWPHHKIMGRFAAYFRHLVHFWFLVNLPYTMVGNFAVFSPTTQLWAVSWPISGIWCTSGF